MNLETIKARIPEYAKDAKLNLGALERITVLTPRQLYGTMLAVAAMRMTDWIVSAETPC